MNVIHSTFGTGTVVSENNDMITIDFAVGRKTLLKKFANLTYEGEGATITPAAPLPTKTKKSRGEKKRARDAREMVAFNALSNMDKLISAFMRINGKVQGDRNSMGYQLISERLSGVWIVAREKGDTKVMDILKSVEASMRCSDKQAYCIAKFADLNGIKYEDDNQAEQSAIQGPTDIELYETRSFATALTLIEAPATTYFEAEVAAVLGAIGRLNKAISEAPEN